MNTLNIVYVMLQFFAMFYIQKYMSTFFQEVKTRKSVYILSHFIYPILVSTLYFLWNIPLINLLGNIVALFIITCNYKANILKKIACAVFLGSFANVGVVKSICKQVQTAAYQGSNHGISATGGFTSHGYSCRNRVSFVN